jgi:hypothetical protein
MPDQQRADQTRADRHGHAVEIPEPAPGGLERGVDQRGERLDVRAARELGHHAAEALVHVDLAGDEVGEHGLPVDDRDRGLVARRLDAPAPSRRDPHGAVSCRRREASRDLGSQAVGELVEQPAQARPELGVADPVQPHDQRVLADLLVVVLPDADGAEPEPGVQPLGAPSW